MALFGQVCPPVQPDFPRLCREVIPEKDVCDQQIEQVLGLPDRSGNRTIVSHSLTMTAMSLTSTRQHIAFVCLAARLLCKAPLLRLPVQFRSRGAEIGFWDFRLQGSQGEIATHRVFVGLTARVDPSIRL